MYCAVIATNIAEENQMLNAKLKGARASALADKVSVELIGTKEADAYLKKNLGNRKPSKITVDRYVNAMNNDAWFMNGETIKFGKSGELLDGQHRLMAVLKSGRPQEMLVVRDIDDSAFHTIDNGKTRNGNDILSIFGCVENTNMVNAAVRTNTALRRGVSTTALDGSDVRMDHFELLRSYQAMPDVDDVIKMAAQWKGVRKLIGYSSLATCYYLFYKISPEQCHLFFKGLESGADLPSGSPILLLRNKIMNLRSDGSRVRSTEIIRLTIAAWNAYRSERKLAYLQGSSSYKLKDIK